jgi:hypothetical protein
MSTPTPETPIASASEAERLIESLNAITDQLEETIGRETAHVRAGRLRDAAELCEAKVEFCRCYIAETMRVISARELIARSLPGAYAALRERHGAFQALLQTNMTVLATARAVAEGIIRGVSGELARKRAPSTYGPTGRANAPSAKASQPLAISRSL